MLTIADDRIVARATTLSVENGGFRVDHEWVLTTDWSVRCCVVRKDDQSGQTQLMLERSDGGWLVDGVARPDLDGASEPDLSITPFCNTLPIRMMMARREDECTIDTCFIDAASLEVSRSRQSYSRLAEKRFRYLDLGFAEGFRAELDVDKEGIVTKYEGLFELLQV